MANAVVSVDLPDEFIIAFLSFPDLVQSQVGDMAAASVDVVYAFRSIECLKLLVKRFQKKPVQYLRLYVDDNGDCHLTVHDPSSSTKNFDSLQKALNYSSLFCPEILDLSDFELTYEQFILLTEGEFDSVFLDNITVTPTPKFDVFVPVLNTCTVAYRADIKGLEIGDEEITQLMQHQPAVEGFISLYNVKPTIDPNLLYDFVKIALPNAIGFLRIRFSGIVSYDNLAAIKATLNELMGPDGRFENCISGDEIGLSIVIRRIQPDWNP